MTLAETNAGRRVVAVDFSDPSIAALDAALRQLTQREGGELHVLTVIEDASGVTKGNRLRKDDLALTEMPEKLRVLVQDRARALDATLPPSHVGLHVRIGLPVPTILQMTIDVDADLLVVGTHGRSGIRRAVMGSVAERLVRLAPCPVLVARPKSYGGLERTAGIEPPCPDCVAARQKSQDATWWCEIHARRRDDTHTYSSAGPVWTHGGMADFHGFG